MVIQEYKKGNLPVLNASKIFLKKGEVCHYFDKAIYEKKIVKKELYEEIMVTVCPVCLKAHECTWVVAHLIR